MASDRAKEMAAEVAVTALYQSDMTTIVGISTSVTTKGGDRTIGSGHIHSAGQRKMLHWCSSLRRNSYGALQLYFKTSIGVQRDGVRQQI